VEAHGIDFIPDAERHGRARELFAVWAAPNVSLGVVLTLYALLVSDFLDTVSNMLELMVALMGPSIAIYAPDILWRRNRYDGRELTDESRGSAFWYSGGVNWAGVTALVVATAVASQCVNTSMYTGPTARAAGGTDLSLPVGILVSAAVYVAMMRSRRPATGGPTPTSG
jgi:purine-cytosine permease-like protein